MKIKVLSDFVHRGKLREKGTSLELEEIEAKPYLAMNIAVKCEEETPEVVEEESKVSKQSKRK